MSYNRLTDNDRENIDALLNEYLDITENCSAPSVAEKFEVSVSCIRTRLAKLRKKRNDSRKID